MPRSFLVKKPSSTRVPNYGQLETRRQESNGVCHAGRGTAFPLLMMQGAAACPAPCEVGQLWDHSSSVIPRLSLPLPQSSEAKGGPSSSLQASLRDPAGGTRAPSTPLRDNPNNLNLPSAFSPPPKRTPNLGSLQEAEGEKLLGEQVGEADPLGRFECSDYRKPGDHSFSGLARHRQQCCKLQPVRKYFSCKYCDKEYASLGALKMHIRTHTLPCVCKICGKAFSRPWLLQGHIRTHTGEKPYSCSHCSRAFADRSNLRAHLQTHSDIKKYQCRSCSKTFSRMSLLLRHEEAGCCPTAGT